MGVLGGGLRWQIPGRYQPWLSVLLVWALSSDLAAPRGLKAHVQSKVCYSRAAEDQALFDNLEYVDFSFYFLLPFLMVSVTSGLSSWRLKYSVKHIPCKPV